ncbi:MAG TPA: hypothetical protein VK993_11280 [Chthoniobacterales bacterium]|nr:hypothetical protein [Chthoniobacterales bacterium]
MQVYDPSTRQYIFGNSFTVNPPAGVVLAVGFRPVHNGKAEANITFDVDDLG